MVGVRVGQGVLGLDELGAHALAQLLARRPAERDHEHLLERGDLPSATYRVTSAAIVQVLPVPALASSRVVPVGSGSQMSKTSG